MYVLVITVIVLTQTNLCLRAPCAPHPSAVAVDANMKFSFKSDCETAAAEMKAKSTERVTVEATCYYAR